MHSLSNLSTSCSRDAKTPRQLVASCAKTRPERPPPSTSQPPALYFSLKCWSVQPLPVCGRSFEAVQAHAEEKREKGLVTRTQCFSLRHRADLLDVCPPEDIQEMQATLAQTLHDLTGAPLLCSLVIRVIAFGLNIHVSKEYLIQWHRQFVDLLRGQNGMSPIIGMQTRGGKGKEVLTRFRIQSHTATATFRKSSTSFQSTPLLIMNAELSGCERVTSH